MRTLTAALLALLLTLVPAPGRAAAGADAAGVGSTASPPDSIALAWPAIVRTPVPDAANELARLRPLLAASHKDRLSPDEEAAWERHFAGAAPLPGPLDIQFLRRVVERRKALIDALLEPGLPAFQFPEQFGPETAFPDNAPLRSAAQTLAVSARLAAASGDWQGAAARTIACLRLARRILENQEAFITAITGLGALSSGLDTAEVLLAAWPASALDDRLPLHRELASVAGLPGRATARALESEAAFFFRRVLDRLPDTDNPVELRDAVINLGIPGSWQEGSVLTNPFGPAPRPLLDRIATAALYARRAAPYAASVAAGTLPPRGHFTRDIERDRQAFLIEVGPLAEWIFEQPDAESLRRNIDAWRTRLAEVDNLMGKVLLFLNAPRAEQFAESAFRREAQIRALLISTALRDAHRASGSWSATLDAAALQLPSSIVIDPYSQDGLPFGWNPRRQRLWSRGPDREDNGAAAHPGNFGNSPDLAWDVTAAR